MTRNKWVAGAVLVVVSAGMTAQTAQTAKAPTTAATAPAGGEGGVKQGITVHGHWVMKVRDAQGKVVEHREFENELQKVGQTTLISLLIGSVTPGYLQLAAQQTTSSGGISRVGLIFPAEAASLYTSCSTSQNQSCGANLTVTPVTASYAVGNGTTTQAYFSGLTLEGTFKAKETITVNRVASIFYGCQAPNTALFDPKTTKVSLSPVTCPGALIPYTMAGDGTNAFLTLTGTDITPLSVQAGQTLDLTVVLSFS